MGRSARTCAAPLAVLALAVATWADHAGAAADFLDRQLKPRPAGTGQ